MNPNFQDIDKMNLNELIALDPEMVSIFYFTGTITKPEKNATNQLWEEFNQNKSLYSRLKSFALKCFKSREIGIYETIDKLLGFGMCEISEKVEFLAINLKTADVN